MDIGNCVRGVMNKEDWKDIIARYRAATGLVHDREKLAGRLRQLKGQWGFCNKLRYASGLGRASDGTIVATDQWWNDNTKVIAECTSLLHTTNLVKRCLTIASNF
jgi:hypothetical protein